MLVTADKILVHFNTDDISVYRLKNNTLKALVRERVLFEKNSMAEILLEKIDIFLVNLEETVGVVNNERIRLYATGIFQSLTQENKTRLIIHIFVNWGLYFNIVSPDLEQFYEQMSMSAYNSKNIIEGLVKQEFRKVVICGSFQNHLNDIGDVMTIMQNHNVDVLSPWTTKVVPETLETDFILLEGQEPLVNKRDAWTHKYEHMRKMKQSDAIIVCNPDGLVGKGTMFEFGFIVGISKRIIFTDRPKALSLPFPFEVGLNILTKKV